MTSGKSPQGLATPQEGQPLASSASTGRDDAGANNPCPDTPDNGWRALRFPGLLAGNFQPPQADGTRREAALAETHPPATGATTTSGLESPAPLLAARVRWSNGIARTVRDRVPIPASWGPDPESQALDFFDAYGSQFGIDDARQQLTVSSVVRTPEGSSVVTLDRVHEGRPVFGAQARVHIASSGDITFVSASFPNTIQVPQEAGRIAHAGRTCTARRPRRRRLPGDSAHRGRARCLQRRDFHGRGTRCVAGLEGNG